MKQNHPKHLGGLILAFFIILQTPLSGLSQGWQTVYDLSRGEFGNAAGVSRTGGYWVAGTTENGSADPLLTLLGESGNKMGAWTFGTQEDEEIYGLTVSGSGAVILGGKREDNTNGRSGWYFVKVDAGGNEVWTAYDSISGTGNRSCEALVEYSDGSLYFTGFDNPTSSRPRTVLGKRDAAGNLLWRNLYGGSPANGGQDLLIDDSGNLVFVGWISPTGSNDTIATFFRTDSSGTVLDSQQLALPGFQTRANAIVGKPGGGFWVAGNRISPVGEYAIQLWELNDTGLVLFDTAYGGAGQRKFATHLATAPDGRLAISGYNLLNPSLTESLFLLTDPQGRLTNETTWGSSSSNRLNHVLHTPDNFWLLSGTDGIISGSGTADVFAAKTGGSGKIEQGNRIQGRILFDKDASGNVSAGDSALSGWIVRRAPGPMFRFTNQNGEYTFPADSGTTYTVQAIRPHYAWLQILPGTNYSLTPQGLTDTLSGNDFLFSKAASCPLLTVDLSAPIVANNDTARYRVNYCNLGTSSAQNTEIRIFFPPWFSFLSSLPAPANQINDTLIFNPGTLAAGDCGSLDLRFFVEGDSTFPGATHCVTAEIFPHDPCGGIPGWDSSQVEVNGSCEPDTTVRFEISNVGTGAMGSPGGVIVVEDDIMRFDTTVQLLANDSRAFSFPLGGGINSGSTWYMKVYQTQAYAGVTEFAVFVEGCGADSLNPPSRGFATVVEQNDAYPWRSIDCQQDANVAGNGPIFKGSQPTGIGTQHIISPYSSLEYLIRFRNTGSDTVNQVVIRDTLSGFLDFSTFIPGASSHPAQIQLLSNRIVEWRLDQTQLPPASTDPTGSYGFVKFRINPDLAQLDTGDVILNHAGVFMEGQSSVFITNQTFHTLSDTSQIDVSRHEGNFQGEPFSLLVYPNPTRDKINFLTNRSFFEPCNLQIFDLSGQLKQEITWPAGTSHIPLNLMNFPAGVYIFRMTQRGQLLSSGRIVRLP